MKKDGFGLYLSYQYTKEECTPKSFKMVHLALRLDSNLSTE